METVSLIKSEIAHLLEQKNYPCVAALQSFHRDDYWIRTYNNFGKHFQRESLRDDLLTYLAEYQKTMSTYFTFWAVFKDSPIRDEDEFEQLLWSELSALTSEEKRVADQDPRFSVDPGSKSFCFSLGGKAFFVVGLHPKSSRTSRKFAWPTLIFNVYEQFDQLSQMGKYQPMIQLNRERDVKFQGSVNPMAKLHNDDWESIQFSGKQNPATWKCPFHFRKTENSV